MFCGHQSLNYPDTPTTETDNKVMGLITFAAHGSDNYNQPVGQLAEKTQ